MDLQSTMTFALFDSQTMSESLTLVVALLMITISFVITAWAAFTLTLRKKSKTDQTLYILFSVLLATQPGVVFLLRNSFHASYLSAALFFLFILCSLAGSFLLFVLGIVLWFALRRERPFAIAAATCLSAAAFTALCFAILR
jgi:hypothetical protein